METLDPKIAKQLEDQAVSDFSNDSLPTRKSRNKTPRDYYHTQVLAKFKSAFPFEIFRDELIVSERRVIWVHKMGPWMSRVVSVMHQDIADIEASSGPLVGHLHIRNFTGGEEIIMEHLWKKDLARARDIVEGLMVQKRIGTKSTKTPVAERIEKMTHIDL